MGFFSNFGAIGKINTLIKQLEPNGKAAVVCPPRASFIAPLWQNMIAPLRQNKNDPCKVEAFQGLFVALINVLADG